MMPRKPFPHPELEHQSTQPIPGIYPNSTGAPEQPTDRRRQQ
jgi:carboxypeptidase Q